MLTALRLGAYQMVWLSRIPVSAAVNESVALARRAGAHRWTGFVNAVLRALARTEPMAWPDPATDPVHALEIRYACPAWLVERWLSRVGLVQAERLCAATLEVPPLTLRVNPLRTTREALAVALAWQGIPSEPTPVSPVGLVLPSHGAVTELPGFDEGHFYIEDEGGQLVAPLLDPQPGERILDACAAPGGKATHLAALLQNTGEVVAVDPSARRLQQLADNAARLGASVLHPVQADLTKSVKDHDALARPFDRVLVDAPCSGLGVLRRHPEGKWQKRAAALPQHQTRQLAILSQVAPLLRPGGCLLYSTCSTEPEENEQVIAHFCTIHPEFSRESVAPWLPPAGRHLLTADGAFSTVPTRDAGPHTMDGFFAARLRKGS